VSDALGATTTTTARPGEGINVKFQYARGKFDVRALDFEPRAHDLRVLRRKLLFERGLDRYAQIDGGGSDLIIHAGRLIDGVSDTPCAQVSVLIQDNRIVSIESGFIIQEGYRVIDLSLATLLPSLNVEARAQ
jgi:hypothetical protein